MKVTAIIILLILGACISTLAQKYLTKEEIFEDQIKSHKIFQLPKDSIQLTLVEDLNIRLRNRISSLKQTGIDSFIVYSVSYPGYTYRLDSCTSNYGTSAYLIWKTQEKVTIEKFRGQCQSIILSDKSPDIFAFYDTHHSQLKNEIFMPIIYNAYTNKNNGIIYIGSTTSHEPKYFLYYDIDSNHNSFSFGESELNDEKNIFYKYNLNLTAYLLWKLISGQVE